jgi:hypothetical protein
MNIDFKASNVISHYLDAAKREMEVKIQEAAVKIAEEVTAKLCHGLQIQVMEVQDRYMPGSPKLEVVVSFRSKD